MENRPDSFVIVPAILHVPSQFASVRIAMGGRNRLQVLQNTQSHARGMPLLRKAATLNHVIA
jgi:hypothetical protein